MAPSHCVPLLLPQVTHIDSKVLGGTGDGPLGRESFWDVLQCHGRGADDAGETDDGKALGPTKCPAVPRVDIWLQAQEQDTSNVTTISAIFSLTSARPLA